MCANNAWRKRSPSRLGSLSRHAFHKAASCAFNRAIQINHHIAKAPFAFAHHERQRLKLVTRGVRQLFGTVGAKQQEATLLQVSA